METKSRFVAGRMVTPDERTAIGHDEDASGNDRGQFPLRDMQP